MFSAAGVIYRKMLDAMTNATNVREDDIGAAAAAPKPHVAALLARAAKQAAKRDAKKAAKKETKPGGAAPASSTNAPVYVLPPDAREIDLSSDGSMALCKAHTDASGKIFLQADKVFLVPGSFSEAVAAAAAPAPLMRDGMRARLAQKSSSNAARIDMQEVVHGHVSQVRDKINWDSPDCAYVLKITGVTAKYDGRGEFYGITSEAALEDFIRKGTKHRPAVGADVRHKIAMRRAQFGNNHVQVIVLFEISGQIQWIVTGLGRQ
jgi:hypothetical protein